MKAILFLAMFISQASIAQMSHAWNAYFEGTIMEVPVTLTGKTIGNQWMATMDASGYIYELQGTVDGNTCQGNISDPQLRSTMTFTAQYASGKMVIHLDVTDPQSGMQQGFDMHFNETTPPEASVQPEESTPNSSQLDPSLFGKWRRTETYVSGDYSFATDYFVQFDSNGTAWYTDGQTAGGGSNTSISSGKGQTHQASWKTENQILYANDGSSGWVPYARYYVERNSLMVTFDNGTKQVWERY